MGEPRAVPTFRSCEHCGAVYYSNDKIFHAKDCPTQVETPKPQPVPTTFHPYDLDLGFTACWDRLVIVEDQFQSGYECKDCKGTGKVPCTECDNGTSRLNPNVKCKTCNGATTHDCPACGGKGATIIIPDTAQRRPTTGKVVSAGEKCMRFKEGDSVLFSNFAGHDIKLKRGYEEMVIRVLHETEIICMMSGLLTMRTHKDFVEMTTI